MQRTMMVSVWEPLLERLKKKLDSACLRRDQYLDRVLSWESQALLTDVPRSNSNEARAYIAKSLGLLPRKPVNFKLGATTIEQLNAACAARNVPRDAFVNRILLFLVAKDALFKKLIEIDWDWAREQVMDKGDIQEFGWGMLNGSLSAVSDIVSSDPFWFVRRCMEMDHGSESYQGLHDVRIPKNVLGELAESAIGFNCYLHDVQIEGGRSRNAVDSSSNLLDELLGETTK